MDTTKDYVLRMKDSDGPIKTLVEAAKNASEKYEHAVYVVQKLKDRA